MLPGFAILRRYAIDALFENATLCRRSGSLAAPE
jgi:hypothetical protein